MSARAAIKHAVEGGWCWAALVLFDPPNIPPEGHPIRDLMRQHGQRLIAWAQNRRERFIDPSELAAQFRSLRVHQQWVNGAHELMARALLRQEEGTGDWVLVCPGALEAQMYQSNIALPLWPHATALRGPVQLVGADPTVAHPGIPALANKALADTNGWCYEFIPGSGHMVQLEQPEACCRVLRSFLAEHRIIRATE
jgi:pimeloyl-ACP methyl ester carboxylesterase